jgi:hypothetical protein
MFSRRPAGHHNRGRVASGAVVRPIWPPTQVSGLVGWWDTQETFTESGGFVADIRNMASGVDAAEATFQPAYDATGLNGYPCMVGNGAAGSRRFITTEAAVVAAFSGAAKALTYICVCQVVTGTGAAMAMMGAGNSALVANSSWRIGTGATDIPVISKRGTVTVSVASASAITAAAQILSFRTNGTTADIWRGTTKDVTGSSFVDTGAPAPDRFGLLCYPVATPASFFNGKWGCGLLFNRALSDAELSGIILGLKVRWSI